MTGSNCMIVMPSNNTGFEAGRLFGKFPKRLAHLQTVDSPREPYPGTPWALDNGVYGAWSTGRAWSEEPFYRYLEKYAPWNPLWVTVPDWVADRERTLRLWDEHYPAVSAFQVPLAFVVQDGMTVGDVPIEAAVIFVGGSFTWKWRTLRTWTEHFARVHVGRVNSRRLLEQAEEAGAESCDGTGWFRDPTRTRDLEDYLSAPKSQLELIKSNT